MASWRRWTPTTRLPRSKEAGGSEDDEAAVAQAANQLITEALKPLSSNPDLRGAILDARKSFEQTIDEVSKDTLLVAGHSDEGREKAAALVDSFGSTSRSTRTTSAPYRFSIAVPTASV